MTKAKVEQVRQLNDALRRTFTGGKVYMTHSVAALSDEERAEIFLMVQTYEDFSLANDPYGEHDMGFFTFRHVKYAFKIQYFSDESLNYGAEDATKCTRVLTIMQAADD